MIFDDTDAQWALDGKSSVRTYPLLAQTVPLSAQTPWLAYHRPLPGARLRLFCFHHAGGSASVFHPWAALLQPYQIELCPVQLPGREKRINEAPYTNLNVLIAQLYKELAPYTNLPFAFLGHSMGAVIAFHLAHQFQRRARPPERLILSAATPPQARRHLPIHHLPDGAFIEQVEQYNGLPTEVLQNQELMALVLPALRADFALCEHADRVDLRCGKGCVPPVLRCPFSVFTGLADQSVADADLEQWHHHTVGGVKVRKFPGDHFFLYKHRALVIRAIVQDLFSVTV